jgi:hypothetical protein
MSPTPWFGYTTFSPSLKSMSLSSSPELRLQILGLRE